MTSLLCKFHSSISLNHHLVNMQMATAVDDEYAARSLETPALRTRHEAEDRAADRDDDSIISPPRPRRISRGRSGYRGVEEMASWSGQPSVKGSTEAMRMALLTFSMAGLQYVGSRRCLAMANSLLQVHMGN